MTTEKIPALAKFETEFTKTRDAHIETFTGNDDIVFVVDGIPVLATRKKANGDMQVRMLPDLYTLTDFTGVDVVGLLFDIKDTARMTVHLTIASMEEIDILTLISEAAAEINLYGYKN